MTGFIPGSSVLAAMISTLEAQERLPRMTGFIPNSSVLAAIINTLKERSKVTNYRIHFGQ